jgi:eukaryotic-like serine/threonine-protein kinase
MSDDAPTSRAHYQVITTLGQGGMARVLLTLSRGPAGVDKLLVVKELKAELKGDPDFLTMFLDEARIAARLNHPNVIQTYEVSSDGEHPLIVMEYLEGQSLSALLGRVSRKAMPLDVHVHVLSQTAAGLHYAHELRGLDGTPLDVVHRDVSPHNVFVTYDGLVKLVDFGIAKAAGSAGVTQAGQFKGKIGYASPEQLGGGAGVDRRTDVFALGVMLWEAVARRRMTMGEEQARVMNRRLRGEDPKLLDVVPDAPEALARICEKAMAFDPEERFATAADLRAALEAWLDGERRTGAEDVAALVQTSFAEDREKIRSIVEARMKELAAAGPASDFSPFSRRGLPPSSLKLPPPAEPTLLAASRVPPAPQSEPSDATMRAAASPASAGPPPAEPERRFGLVLAGVGVAVAVAITAVQLSRGGGATGAGAVASAVPAETAETTAAVAAAPATVDVSISVDPPEARVFLDDVALASNPFHGGVPRSTLARRLRVTAPGYAPEERLVTLDRDLHLELALKAAPAAAAANPPPARAGRDAPAGTSAVKAPPVATAAPGEALTSSTRKKPRTIDSEF